MEVLDLRARGERWLAARWERPYPPGPLARLAAAAAGRTADALAARRAAGRGMPPATPRVISVGNLRVGGTGKTPVTLQLARDLAADGLPGAVLCRGYGAVDPRARRVDPGDETAGDEARLLAAALSPAGWEVHQGRDRGEVLRRLRARPIPPAVVLLEDGHQTAGVPRHVDVLILDRWREEGGLVTPLTGPVLPLGPYRETVRGTRRAAVWLLERTEPWPASGLESESSATGTAVVTGFRRDLTLEPRISAIAAGAAVGLLSGLARPDGFETGAAAVAGGPVRLAVRCADHCRYTAKLVDRFLAAGRQWGVGGWITTEKDWAKLARLWPVEIPVAVARLNVIWLGTPTLPELIRERVGI